MKSLQDKICDGLTLVGLLAVIGFGSASLLPESQPEEEAEPAATTDSIAAPVDTLRSNVRLISNTYLMVGKMDRVKPGHESEVVLFVHKSRQTLASSFHFL